MKALTFRGTWELVSASTDVVLLVVAGPLL